MLGGAVFGVAGAIVGSVTGKKELKKAKLTEGKIVIYYDDIDNPIENLLFIGGSQLMIDPEKKVVVSRTLEESISIFHARLCACISACQDKGDTDTHICPYCAENIKVAAVKCKHCGSDVGLS